MVQIVLYILQVMTNQMLFNTNFDQLHKGKSILAIPTRTGQRNGVTGNCLRCTFETHNAK